MIFFLLPFLRRTTMILTLFSVIEDSRLPGFHQHLYRLALPLSAWLGDYSVFYLREMYHNHPESSLKTCIAVSTPRVSDSLCLG